MMSSFNMWHNVHIQTHIWGRGAVWARYNIKNNRFTQHMYKQMYARLFLKKMRKEWASLFCLQLFMSHRSAHEFTWTQTEEAETRKNKLLSNQIFTFHQNQNSHSDSSRTVESDLSGTVTVMEYGSGLNVFVCLGKLLSLYSWVYFPFWVTGKCVFLHCISTLTTVLDLQHHFLNLL